jgi:hypothetical protein
MSIVGFNFMWRRCAAGGDNRNRREIKSMAKGMDRKKETKKPKKDKK